MIIYFQHLTLDTYNIKFDEFFMAKVLGVYVFRIEHQKLG